MKQIKSAFYHQGKWIKFTAPIKVLAYFSDYYLDVLTGKKTSYSPEKLLQKFHATKLSSYYPLAQIYHFTYEWGKFLSDPKFKIKKSDIPYCLELVYKDSLENLIVREDFCYHQNSNFLIQKKDFPSFEHYKNAYKRGREFLINGDCYQYNLTFPFFFHIENKEEGNSYLAEDFIGHFLGCESSKIAQMAHYTDIPHLDFCLLSNSPECLMQIKRRSEGNRYEVASYPIKGTVPIKRGPFFSVKEQAELDMITDLMRHDLGQLSGDMAKVEKRRALLVVNGLFHQYSEIKTEMNKLPSLGKLLNTLFPGGSITGAPKKRVINILDQLESYSRGYYSGSTFFFYGHAKAASINIRTALLQAKRKVLLYGAGGGITLKGDCALEYQEMNEKVKSFISLFTNEDFFIMQDS